jgi:hypothetical protein
MTERSSRISEASTSVDDVNVPEIDSLRAEFVYNYYVKNERTSNVPLLEEDTRNLDSVPIDKLARYVNLSWRAPVKTTVGYQSSSPNFAGLPTVAEAARSGKILTEDNFFNPGYVNHTFSNIAAVEQGSTDIENYSRLSNDNTESIFQMSNLQVKKIGLNQQAQSKYDQIDQNNLSSIHDAYSQLANLPTKALGLRVYDKDGKLNDEGDLISSITNSISLNVKLNNAVIPDIFGDSSKATPRNLQNLAVQYNNLVSGMSYDYQQRPFNPVLVDTPSIGEDLGNSVSVIGYIIDSYVYQNGDFTKNSTYYLDGQTNTSYVDKSVSFGKIYFYTVRTVAAVKLYLYEEGSQNVRSAIVYVSSRPVTTKVTTFEVVPPPEPQQVRFSFDYSKRNLIINWDMPLNTQRDIKQFQVFRRSSIKHPFELIAQYGFDDSLVDTGGSKYKTGELVDANNYDNMRTDLRYLVKQKEGLVVTSHVDEDFTVDPELYQSSEYIYAICSVDAHGLVSNYSTQYRVTFDSYRNRLKTSVVCDSGCPKQYPNLKLNVDTFKDVISVSGDSSKKLNLYFTPNKYLKLRDVKRSTTFNIVEAKTPGNPHPYYLLQLINLDNQKMQLIKINVNDPERLTLT